MRDYVVVRWAFLTVEGFSIWAGYSLLKASERLRRNTMVVQATVELLP